MGMAIEQEVRHVTSSPLGALTEGIPHRRGKGAGPEYRVGGVRVGSRHDGVPPARGCPVEAIGAGRSRTEVKRRKASREGELVPSSDAQYPLHSGVYWRRDGLEARCSYPRPCAGFRQQGR
jgi:hypothetical protein